MSAVAVLLLALIGTDRLGDPLGPGVTARYGTTRLCQPRAAPVFQVTDRKQGDDRRDANRAAEPPPLTVHPPDELRRNTPGRQFWQRLDLEPDTDPQVLLKPTPDGRRCLVIQTRHNDKADRYRGYPECFAQVFDTAARRPEAWYAFRLDDIGTGERLKPSEEGDGGYSFRDFTPSADGSCLAWVDHDGCLRIRHLPTGRVVTTPGRYRHAIRLAFSPNNKRLTVLDEDRIIRLIDPHTGRFQTTADSPPTAARLAAVSPDGKLVATGHTCGEVWVWDAVTGKPLWHIEADGEPVRELHFNPTGTTVSAVGFWGPIGVRTFDAKTGKELGPMLPYRYFRTIAVSADGKRIADLIEEKSIMEKGGWAHPLFVRTREVATGKELNRVRLDHRLGLPKEDAAVISCDGRVTVVTHTNGATFAYDTATGKRLCGVDSTKLKRTSGPMAVSADGRFVVRCWNESIPDALLGSGWIAVFDTASGTETTLESKLDNSIHALSISTDGRYVLAKSGVEVHPHIYDTRSRQLERWLKEHERLFFPDGNSVLAQSGIRGAERVSLEPLAWKVAPPPKPTEARLAELWKQLGEPAALNAVFELVRYPAEAVPFLKAKLQTDPPDPKAVAGHIGKLGSKLFAERDAATKALRELGPEVLPVLRAALKADPLPEARSRIEKLLPVLADTAAPFTLTRLRAVEALERCGTPDARAVLEAVARRPGTPWADDASRARARLLK